MDLSVELEEKCFDLLLPAAVFDAFDAEAGAILGGLLEEGGLADAATSVDDTDARGGRGDEVLDQLEFPLTTDERFPYHAIILDE